MNVLYILVAVGGVLTCVCMCTCVYTDDAVFLASPMRETQYRALIEWTPVLPAQAVALGLVGYSLEYQRVGEDGGLNQWMSVDNTIPPDTTSYIVNFPSAGNYSYRLSGLFTLIGRYGLSTQTVYVPEVSTQGK